MNRDSSPNGRRSGRTPAERGAKEQVRRSTPESVSGGNETPRARQKPTRPDSPPPEAADLYDLTPRQAIALELVLAGTTDQEVAEEVGVTRQTVNEWKNAHPAFKAEVTRRTRELTQTIATRALAVRFKALDVVEEAIEKGNLNAALSYLRLALPTPDETGPTDPRSIVAESVRDPVADLMRDLQSASDRQKVERDVAERLTQAQHASD